MTQDQLQREARMGLGAAAAAAVAIVLTIGSVALQTSLKSVRFHNHTIKPTSYRSNAELLILTHHQPGRYLALAVVGTVALVFMGFVLFYLYTATLARRPEVPSVLRWLTLVAPLLSGVIGIVNQIKQADAATKFVHLPAAQQLGSKGATRATNLVSHTLGAVQYVGYVAGILLILAFVMTSIYAMRTGLLSRGMGYFGAAVGVFMLLPLLGPATTFVQILWLGAIGLLVANRWPGGRGPAWEAGAAIPWPTPAERRAQMEGAEPEPRAKEPRPAPRPSGGALAKRVRAASREEDQQAGAATAVDEPESQDGAPAPAAHPRSKKRKRKRR